MHRASLALILILSASACSGGTRSEQPTDKPVEKPKYEPEETATEPSDAEVMRKHWIEAGRLRGAVVMGDLEAAKEIGKAMSRESPIDGEEFAPFVAEMTKNLKTVSSASTLSDAAGATGRLGATCGKCHASAGAKPTLSLGKTPEGDDPRSHMLRHAWAVNAMWQGLVGPSDDRWTEGAAIFTDTPLHPGPDEADYEGSDRVEAMTKAIHEVGTRAASVTDPDERATLFGELVGTCGGCHGASTMPPE